MCKFGKLKSWLDKINRPVNWNTLWLLTNIMQHFMLKMFLMMFLILMIVFNLFFPPHKNVYQIIHIFYPNSKMLNFCCFLSFPHKKNVTQIQLSDMTSRLYCRQIRWFCMNPYSHLNPTTWKPKPGFSHPLSGRCLAVPQRAPLFYHQLWLMGRPPHARSESTLWWRGSGSVLPLSMTVVCPKLYFHLVCKRK